MRTTTRTNFLGCVAAAGLLSLSAGAHAQSGCTMTTHSPKGSTMRFGPVGSTVNVTDATSNINNVTATVAFTDGSGRVHTATTPTNAGYQFRSQEGSITWTFSPAVPAHRIGVAISDMGGINYQYANYPASLKLTVTGDATRSDFEILRLGSERLGVYDASTGVISKNLAGAEPTQPHGAFMRGTSARRVSTLRIQGEKIYSADHIHINLVSIPNCVTVRKASEHGTGTFGFALSGNLKNFAGTAPAGSTTLTSSSTSATSFTSSSYFFPDEPLPFSGMGTQEVVIREASLPSSHWKLKSVSCSDWNASRTGNTGTFGTVADGTITIPGDRIRFESNIVCDYVNQWQAANVEITKTNAPTGGTDTASDVLLPGSTTVYTLMATNHGPLAADGALVRDEVVSGLNCTAAECTGTMGGAVCPVTTLEVLTGSGVTVPIFPASSSVSFQVTCTVLP